MRIIDVTEITNHIKEMCIEANHFLAQDMDSAMKSAADTEKSPLGKADGKLYIIKKYL